MRRHANAEGALSSGALCAALLLSGCDGLGLTELELYDSGPATPALDSEPAPDSEAPEREPEDDAPAPPVIERFMVAEVNGLVRFTFAVESPDRLREGSFVITAAGQERRYDYPDQAAHDENGDAYVVWEPDAFTLEQTVSCRLVVTDRYGEVSAPATASYTRFAQPVEVPEIGDTLSDVYGLGRVELPLTVEGSLHSASNDGASYTGDIDVFRFFIDTPGQALLTLSWDRPSADVDLFLMVTGPETLTSAATSAHPETLSWTLTADTYYYVAVAGWSGSPGDWSLRIERP